MRIDEMYVGQKYEENMTISEDLVDSFAVVSGDNNPVHVDSCYAEKTRFKRKIAHGMLLAANISRIIGTKFPGYGSIYVSQTMSFCRPCYVGTEITISICVKEISGNRVKLLTEVYGSEKCLLSGMAEIMLDNI